MNPNASANPDATLPPPDSATFMLNAALWYADHGLAVIPLKPTTNIPDGGLLGRGYQYRDLQGGNRDQVLEWWTASPMANIGIVQGRPSGTMVIDLDVKHGDQPLEELKKWMAETGISLERGAVCMTASGGWHYWFKLSDDVADVPSPVGWLPGVDIRADSSQVCVPPSQVKAKTLSGFGDQRQKGPTYLPYLWLNSQGGPHTPSHVEFSAAINRAPAPGEFLEDIRTHRSSRTRNRSVSLNEFFSSSAAIEAASNGGFSGASAGAGSVPVEHYLENGIPPGRQWDEFYRVTWSLLNRGASRSETVQTLEEICRKSSQTREPWVTGDRTDGQGQGIGTSLWAIVNRAFDRHEVTHQDGDAYDARRHDDVYAADLDLASRLLTDRGSKR